MFLQKLIFELDLFLHAAYVLSEHMFLCLLVFSQVALSHPANFFRHKPVDVVCTCLCMCLQSVLRLWAFLSFHNFTDSELFCFLKCQIWLSSKTRQTFLFKSLKTKRSDAAGGEEDGGGVSDSTDSSPERQVYQIESFIPSRRTELSDTWSSVVQFTLLVESCRLCTETWNYKWSRSV